MHEVKKPRKPLIFYYVIVLAILLVFNFLFIALGGGTAGPGSGI